MRAEESPSLPHPSEAPPPATTQHRCLAQTGTRGCASAAPAPAARWARRSVHPRARRPGSVHTLKQTCSMQLLAASCKAPCRRPSLPQEPCSPPVRAAPSAAARRSHSALSAQHPAQHPRWPGSGRSSQWRAGRALRRKREGERAQHSVERSLLRWTRNGQGPNSGIKQTPGLRPHAGKAQPNRR